MNLRYFVFPLLRQFQLSGMPETSLRCFQMCNFETPWKYEEEICQNIFANVVGGGKQLGRKAFIHYTNEIRAINLELNKA